MSKSPVTASKGRILSWLSLILLAIPALWLFMRVTAARLHPDPAKIPSVISSVPEAKWLNPVENAQRIVRAGLSKQNLPGLSVAVGIGGDIVWAEGFGFADLGASLPVTPGHRFRIGTASTALTSAAAGLLLQDGRLHLDDPIQTYVPEFPRKQQPVTLRQLMGHTAGVIPGDGDEGPLYTKHCERPAEAVRYFGTDSLLFNPGTRFRYSSYGWILVSAAIEAAAQRPFLSFMRERVFAPLGMRDTVPDAADATDDDFPLFNLIRERIFDPRARRDAAPASSMKPAANQVTSYFPRFAADPSYGLHLMRPLDYSCYAGSSDFRSTPSDLVRFAMAIDSGTVLQPATVELLRTSQRLPSGEQTGYGLGWDLETVTLAGKQTRVIGHDGELLGGMVGSLMTFPEYGITVSVMSNISYADTFSLAVQIGEAFAQQEGK